MLLGTSFILPDGKILETLQRVARKEASEGVQIHGSNGLTQEYLMEKLFRDTRAGMIADGANEILGQTAAEKLTESYDFQT